MRINTHGGLLILILLTSILNHSTVGQQQLIFTDKLNNAESIELDLYNELVVGSNNNGQSQGFNLSKVTKETLPQHKYSSEELHCLALNIYFEARSESQMGQRAVGHVVMNRLNHPTFPGSICDVVKQGGEQRRYRCQFSWWCDGLSDKPINTKAWEEAFRIASKIYSRESNDPTGGALWYHADYVSPYWQSAYLQGAKIGRHIFYLDSRKLNS